LIQQQREFIQISLRRAKHRREALRTPHAGSCLAAAANSAFYGIAAATNGRVIATPRQIYSIEDVCFWLFRRHGWPSGEVTERLVGHDEQAIWTKEATRAAGIADGDAEKRVGQREGDRGPAR
jgi:hypothetical protein